MAVADAAPAQMGEPRTPFAAPAAPPEPPTLQIARSVSLSTPLPSRDAPLELALDPPELGSIRVSVSRGGEGMVLHFQADLPETLDLLRRHGGALAEELQRHGLDHSSFTFSGREDGRNRPSAPAMPHPDQPTDPPTAPPDTHDPQAARPRDGGLDLRL